MLRHSSFIFATNNYYLSITFTLLFGVSHVLISCCNFCHFLPVFKKIYMNIPSNPMKYVKKIVRRQFQSWKFSNLFKNKKNK